MPKHIVLKPHLELDELEQRYRRAQEGVLRTHYQIIWLLAQGQLTRDVAAATGYSRTWIQEIARRYNAQGAAGLGDQRRRNPGAAPLLHPGALGMLRVVLGEPPRGGGLWTGRQVAAWMSDWLERPVSRQRGWEYLRRLGQTPKVPRPRHAGAAPEAREQFPKDCRSE
jgi:transposase